MKDSQFTDDHVGGAAIQPRERALVFITGPYQLLQAIWFASEHPEYEYDALLKTVHINEAVKNELMNNCVKCGLFSSVHIAKGLNKESGVVHKGLLFLKMVGCWITGQRSRLTQKMIREEIGDNQYDMVIVDSENSLLGGAFIDHSDADYNVVILQEGTSDILLRLNRPNPTPGDIVNYMLARMGYCNPGIFYILDKVRYCTKLSSFPDKLLYKPYAKTERIFAYQGNERYREAIQKAYPRMDWDLLQSADTIVVTSLMETLGGGENEYLAMKRWLMENTKGKMLIKRHPRDVYPYDWNEVDVSFIDAGVPAELILANVTHQTVVFSFISTCMVDIIGKQVDYRVIRFDSLKGDYNNRIFNQLKEQLGIPDDRIVHL